MLKPFEKFDWLRCPVGIKNGVSLFSHLIHKILSVHNPDKCLPYLDDTLIYGSTLEEHLRNLEQVLELLAEDGLMLNAEKCKLVSEPVEFSSLRSISSYTLDKYEHILCPTLKFVLVLVLLHRIPVYDIIL